MQKRTVFWIFWEQSGQAGVANYANIYSDILQNEPFRSQIFKKKFRLGRQGGIDPLTKILRTTLHLRAHSLASEMSTPPTLSCGVRPIYLHLQVTTLGKLFTRMCLCLGTCEASTFDSNSNRRSDSIRFDSDGPIRKFSNRPCLPIARSSQTTQTINST